RRRPPLLSTVFPYTTLFRSVPRLRFVGGGSEFLGATGGFLPGTDDGVVALHSACGGNSIKSVDSCVNYRELDGKQASATAPDARDRKSTRLNSSHVKISYAV